MASIILNILPRHEESHNCLEDLIASVLSWRGYDYSLLYAGSWGFFYKSTDSNLKDQLLNNLGPGWDENLCKYVGKYYGIRLKEDIILDIKGIDSLIKRELYSSYPIILYFDAFYCPWNRSFGKYHIPHTCLVIGTDDVDGIFYCIDPYMTSEVKKFRISDFGQELLKISLFDYCVSESNSIDWREVVFNSIEHIFGGSHSGSIFDMMRRFASDLENTPELDSEVCKYDDIWGSPLFINVTHIGTGRKNYAKLLYFLEKQSNIIDFGNIAKEMDSVWGKWNNIRLMLIQMSILSNRKSTLKMISDKIREIADLEETIGNKLRKLLERESSTIRLDSLILKYAAERKNIVSPMICYSPVKTINMLFEEQVEMTPNNSAVVCNNLSLTYHELNLHSNQLAHILIEKGVKPDVLVGVLLDRSVEMLIAIIAIIKAGGAYLPIDTQLPEDRINFILADSDCKILITQIQYQALLFRGAIIDIKDPKINERSASNPENTCKPDHLIYVMYTSGSTGLPKGVMVEHKSVANFMNGIMDIVDFSKYKRILALTTLSFDISVLELIIPLLKGLTVIVADKYQQLDPAEILNLIFRYNIDILQITPSRLELLLNSKSHLSSFAVLKEIIIGGEALNNNLITELRRYCKAKVYNAYGPTETTIWSTMKYIEEDGVINIGKPILNTQVYIIGEGSNFQKASILGELCIGGEGLARGYLNREELTETKFIPNPFVPGRLMYKTGDIAKILPNGEIEFLGRMDEQVKINGYRVELSEIENCMSRHRDIKNCTVIKLENEKGLCSLAAFYLSEKKILRNELIAHLRKWLPAYMIPDTYVQLDKIPLTSSGKINRGALYDLLEKPNKEENEYIEKINNVEEIIKLIWCKILGINSFDSNQNFFDLGGNSIMLVKMHSEIEKHFPGLIELAEMFNYPTVAKLVSYLER